MSRLIGRAQPMPGLFSGRACGLLAACCLLLAALTDQTEKSGICADWSGRLIGGIGLIAVLALAIGGKVNRYIVAASFLLIIVVLALTFGLIFVFS